MQKYIIFISAVISAVFISNIHAASAQYLDSSGGNTFINKYVSENVNNWNKSIIFVFYNDQLCATCGKTMGMIYNIYQQYYSGVYGYFEINYANDDAYQFSIDYDLMTPLSIVLVKINDGMARGYLKIDNPQFWAADPQFFEQQLTTKINNFFN